MTAIAPQGGYEIRRLDIGRVGQALFGLIQKDPVGTFGLAAGLNAIQALFSFALTLFGIKTAGTTGLGGVAALSRFSAMGPWFAVAGLLGLLIAVLIYGALGWGAVEALEGRTPSLGERLSASGAALLPMIGIAILGYIGIVVGFLLFIVPGVFLATMWSVVMVAAVIDRAGVFGSFSRSAELTKNNRWMILLLMIVYVIGAFVLSLINVFFVSIGLSAGVFVSALLSAVAQVLIGGAISTVGAVGAGVVYQELRTLKGEFDPSRLTRVFG